jgi:pantoate--beta-alanine ligase
LAKTQAKHVIVSIFVNPTQFGPTEDFEAYPRTREADLSLLKEAGVDMAFVPTATTIYPKGLQTTRVYVPQLGDLYCGKSRPLLFEGVCSVVLRLFHIVTPTHAVFGEKDFQQLVIIRQLVEDLYLPIQIIGGPIMREEDGLAMSSRNCYLSAQQRTQAATIYATLCALADTKVELATSIAKAVTRLATNGIRTDYLTLVREDTLEEISVPTKGTRLLFAGYLGNTRLIDNLSLSSPET